MQNQKEIVKYVAILLLGILGVTFAQAQVGINYDDSPPAPHSILTVKGNSGVSLFVNDTSGFVGLSTLNAVSALNLNGQLKLQTPNNGAITDYLMSWSPANGNFNRINPSQIASGPIVFRYENNVIDNSPGTIWQDDFVFGSSQLDDDGNPGHYSRFFFDKGKGAFRAGYVDNPNWNIDSMGIFSTGFGKNVQSKSSNSWVSGNSSTADGSSSFAHGNFVKAGFSQSTTWGNATYARGAYSFAIGDSSTAFNNGSIAMGKNNAANAQYSTAIGEGNETSFSYTIAVGKENQSSGISSSVFGIQNVVSGGQGLISGIGHQHVGSWTFTAGESNDGTGYNSVVLGKENRVADYYGTAIGTQDTTLEDYNTVIGIRAKATDPWGSAIGIDAAALGRYSTAMGNDVEAQYERAMTFGNGLKAQSFHEIAVGSFNTIYTPTAPWTWNSSQRLFVVGNGINDTLRSDAMVVLKNGNVGFGTALPTAKLHVVADTANSLHALRLYSSYNDAGINYGAYSIEVDSFRFTLNPLYYAPVTIGTDSVATDHKLSVGGKVAVEEARTEISAAWPDYVFESDYELPTSQYLEKFILENGHLPNIPSADFIEYNGLDLTAMQIKLLEKIEELTLMIIDMEKKISELETQK